MYEFFQLLGSLSVDLFWFPLLIWSVVAFIAFVALKHASFLNPLYQYHLRLATLAAIPFGFLASYVIHQIRQSTISSGNFEGAIFVVQSPIELAVNAQSATSVFQPDFLNPNFLIGAATALVLTISLFFLIRLLTSYINLKRLHEVLEVSPLQGFQSTKKNIQIAFHDHPLVPFTFGWVTPVIVLPKKIQDQTEKVEMAIQHELVHIERGDYLLQFFLSVIESALWFHPLIRFGAKEIETYREISCDQQVLSTTQVSTKKYASMLFELVPLERGLSGFSVSMAVKQSTLKQRIETMKHHKLYKTSLKRSLLFFFAMTLVITLPIACSDLRETEGLSMEELEDSKLTFNQFIIEANGNEIINLSEEKGVEVGLPANNIAAFNIGEYGIVAISLRPFEGGALSGALDGNKISIELNEINFKISSSAQISESIDKADIWAKLFINKESTLGFGQFASVSSLEEKLRTSSESKFNKEGDYFVVVEEMPKLVGGLASIQGKVEYPEMAKRAGIEGRVTVQFIVNENGEVENPKVIRGIGGGCDEAALEAVKQARFEPGIQKGEPVRVQYSLPIVFRLNDSDFSTQQGSLNEKELNFEVLERNNGTLKVKILGGGKPLIGAEVASNEAKRGATTNSDGIATITNLEKGEYSFVASYLGFESATFNTSIDQ